VGRDTFQRAKKSQRKGESVVRLAVVGSTNVTYPQLLLASKIIRGILIEVPSLIISGGAVGIDSLAEAMAQEYDIRFKAYYPKNNRWEPEGYKERNLLIAGDCTHLLCIRSSQSTTYGSGWTADRAEEMGKIVWRVQI
jgi:predicted Rossmann fold nucleotide-binding protein DprA/Smf involved in DNA uptake